MKRSFGKFASVWRRFRGYRAGSIQPILIRARDPSVA
jgi:hypothetical protein